MSEAPSRLAGGRPVPHIVTELPGPKARAHVAFDEAWTSPSLPRAYPIVPVRGDGLTVEDIDGNLFLDFAAGIAVNSTGHAHPAGRGGDQGAGRGADPLQRVGLLPADLPRGLQAPGGARADQGRPGPDLSRQLGRRGRGGLDQAGALRDASPVRRRVPRRVPWADLRRRLADRVEGEVPRGVRAAPAGRLPRAVRAGRGPQVVRRGPVRQAGARQRGRRDHRRADPGRGRVPRSRGRLPPGPAPDLRRARDPAHRRRDPVRRGADREDVGRRALGRRARHPAVGQGHRVGDAAGRHGRPRRPARVVGRRRARLDLRRQPGRLRGGPRDDRPARGRPHRQRRGARRAGARAAFGRWSTGSTGS